MSEPIGLGAVDAILKQHYEPRVAETILGPSFDVKARRFRTIDRGWISPLTWDNQTWQAHNAKPKGLPGYRSLAVEMMIGFDREMLGPGPAYFKFPRMVFFPRVQHVLDTPTRVRRRVRAVRGRLHNAWLALRGADVYDED